MARGILPKVAVGLALSGTPVEYLRSTIRDATDSITICASTTDPTEAPLFRLVVEPDERNGLRSVRRLVVDKITTFPKTKVGTRVGRLDDEDMVRLNQAMAVFLGMAASPRTGRSSVS